MTNFQKILYCKTPQSFFQFFKKYKNLSLGGSKIYETRFLVLLNRLRNTPKNHVCKHPPYYRHFLLLNWLQLRKFTTKSIVIFENERVFTLNFVTFFSSKLAHFLPLLKSVKKWPFLDKLTTAFSSSQTPDFSPLFLTFKIFKKMLKFYKK